MATNSEDIKEALEEIENATRRIRRALNYIDNSPSEQKSPVMLSSETPSHSSVSLAALPDLQALASYQDRSVKPLNGPEQGVLEAIAWLDRAKPLKMHLTLIAALANYAPSADTFREALETLRARSLILVTAHSAELTERGNEIALVRRSPLTSALLAERLCNQLGPSQRQIFRLLFERGGAAVSLEEIVEASHAREKPTRVRKDISALEKLALVDRVANSSYACADIVYIEP